MGSEGCDCRAAHIVLVGTSVLRNFSAALERCAAAEGRAGADDCHKLGLMPGEALELVGKVKRCAYAPPCSNDDYECIRIFTPASQAQKALDNYIDSDPYRASAELNAMKHAIQSGCTYINEVALFVTDTGAGRAAGDALKRFINSRCPHVKVSMRIVGRFCEASEMLSGIVFLIREIQRDIVGYRSQGYAVAINLTGGFKPESGAGLLASLLSGAHAAYYIHELFRDIVMIPYLQYFDTRFMEVLAKHTTGDTIDLEKLATAPGITFKDVKWVEKLGCALASIKPNSIGFLAGCKKLKIGSELAAMIRELALTFRSE